MNQPQLKREAFATSRLMDFFSQKELITQTGHDIHEWPLVCLKELIDNSLDACEEVGVQPSIVVTVDDIGITVKDNGPGIPADTVEKMLDYSIRVSSREAYVSPDRGAQGNALKTLIAMPFVLNGQHGTVDIVAQGILHTITAEVDRIKQEPVLEHEQFEANVKTGNKVTVYWPVSASSILEDAKSHFLQMAHSFTLLNPHLNLSIDWYGEVQEWTATMTDKPWVKWSPSSPTSAHWYTVDTLSRLIAGYVSNNPEKTVREFITEFRGLKGTAKQKKILAAMDISGQTLDYFVTDGDMDHGKIQKLLDSMCEHSVAPAPKLLGVIGKDHLHARCEEMGCDMDTFGYQKVLDLDESGMPSIAEVAFAAWLGDGSEDKTRILVSGVNWSVGIDNPFRKLGEFGETMDSVLTEARAGRREPIIMIIHMACPSVKYSDHGKSSIVLEK